MRPVEWALRYAPAGLSVVPIAGDGTKQPPAGQAWKHLQERIAGNEEIRSMFAGDVGIAVINGGVSGNLETLDIDDPALVEPSKPPCGKLRRTCSTDFRRLPRPGMAVVGDTTATGSKASSPATRSSPKANSALNSRTTARPTSIRKGKQRRAPETLIETRGEGGYAIAPGSPDSCHDTGLPYRHIAGPELTESRSAPRRDTASSGTSRNRSIVTSIRAMLPTGQSDGKNEDAPGSAAQRRRDLG